MLSFLVHKRLTMANYLEKWIFSFAVTETQRHKNFTTYKVTSIIIPKNTPEALSCITVIKRFREVKQLYKDICSKTREAKINSVHVPEIQNTTFFNRFSPAVVEERKNYIIKLLNFIGDHPVLFRSEAFVKFFDASQNIVSPEIRLSINDNQSVNKSLQTFSPDDLMINDEDMLCVQSNNLEAFSEEVKMGDDVLDQVRKQVFPQKFSGDPGTKVLIEKISEKISLDRTLEDTRKYSVDDNSFDYLYKAALWFTEAVEAEAIGMYQKAFDSYKAGIDQLLSGVKHDGDMERKKIVREKVTKYLAKAEDIYENFIFKENQNNSVVLVSSKSVEKSFVEITANIERPLNYFSRFKILKIVDGLQQVQDVTDKKVYIMKVLQKPHSLQASRLMYFPQESRFMVPLITYCQTNTSIFLLLKLMSGGKLWDYIKSYQSKSNPVKLNYSDTYKNIFAEPPTKTDPVCRILSQLPKEVSSDVKPFVSIDGNYLHFTSIPSTLELDNKEPIVPYDTLSPEMEINDLLKCSQKLLTSVSSTLQRSKNSDTVLEDNSLESIDSDLDSDVDEGSIGEILKEILEADDTTEKDRSELLPQKDSLIFGSKLISYDVPSRVSPYTLPNVPRVRLLPAITVRQYCAELVCAIDDLHSHGIVCGDLSLDNILLGDKGQLQLTYFYRNDARLSCPNKGALKCFYVAPERPLTKISDSWSLGVILFELLTEQRFFELHMCGLDYYAELQFDSIEVCEEAQDLLQQLIEIDTNNRLSISQVKQHRFFKLVDWISVKEKGKVLLK